MSEIKKVQIGDLITGDFKEKTLTFEIENDFIIKSGKYAIIEQETFKELKRALNSCVMSMNVHPDNTQDSEFEGFISLGVDVLNKI